MHRSLSVVVLLSPLVCACGSPPVMMPQPSAAAESAPAPPATAAPSADATERATAVPSKGPFPQSTDPAMREPSKANAKAPATFSVSFVTTVGTFQVECTRDWAPNGVDRFYNLVKIGFFDDVAFFRVVKQPQPFVVQFGIHGNPSISKLWNDARIPVDKPKQSNLRGLLTFAMGAAPDTRTTQLFINFGANPMLDKMGFAPICKVAGDGMDVVDRIEGAYGEDPMRDSGDIQTQGNTMLRSRYPFLDYIQTARLVEPAKDPR